jgi:chromosome segregation ATPase
MGNRTLHEMYLRVKDGKSLFILPGEETAVIAEAFERLVAAEVTVEGLKLFNDELGLQVDRAFDALGEIVGEVEELKRHNTELEACEEELELELDASNERGSELQAELNVLHRDMGTSWQRANVAEDVLKATDAKLAIVQAALDAIPVKEGDRVIINDPSYAQHGKVGTIITPSQYEQSYEFTVHLDDPDFSDGGVGNIWFAKRDSVSRYLETN